MIDDERLRHFHELLVERFDLDPEDLKPAARLYEDLDLDSIDAVDLAIVIREVTGQKIDPQNFRRVRTVGDVETEVRRLLNAN